MLPLIFTPRQNMTKHIIECLIRKVPVECTPEEKVRQNFLAKLLNSGYPPSCIVVERGVRDLSHVISFKKPPLRRIDVACFGKDSQGVLRPLLIVECKAVKLSPYMLRQVFGYNLYINAPFVALAGKDEFLLIPATHFSTEIEKACINYLPSFEELEKSAFSKNA